MNMLRRINNKSVGGQDFTVTVVNVHQVQYSQDGKTAILEIEGESSKSGHIDWVVYAQTLKGWLPPHESEELSDTQRTHIVDKIGESLFLLEMPNKII